MIITINFEVETISQTDLLFTVIVFVMEAIIKLVKEINYHLIDPSNLDFRPVVVVFIIITTTITKVGFEV